MFVSSLKKRNLIPWLVIDTGFLTKKYCGLSPQDGNAKSKLLSSAKYGSLMYWNHARTTWTYSSEEKPDLGVDQDQQYKIKR